MNWFNDLKIGTKLLSAFVLLAFLAGILGYIGIINIHKIDDADTQLYVQHTAPLQHVAEAAVSFQRIRVSIRGLIISKDPEESKKYLNTIAELDDKIANSLNEVARTAAEKEVLTEVDNLRALIDQYAPIREKIINLATANQDQQAAALVNVEGISLIKAIEKSMDKLFQLEVSLAKETADDNTKLANAVSRSMLIMMLIVVILAIALGVFISRTISRPIRRLTGAANKIAVGDVEISIEADSKDEVGELMQAFGKMADNIRKQANAAERIAAGDLTLEVEVKSEKDILAKSMGKMVGSLKSLVSETADLTQAAVEGNLSTRSKAEKFQGGYREIVEGFNQTLDAVVEPVQEALTVLQEMSKGNLQVNVAGNYKGDHALIKDALNETINTIAGYVKEITRILTEISQGNLVVEISRYYKGDFVDMKESINLIIRSLNEVLGEINIAAEQVASGARQVSSSSQVLSQGSTEQASSIEEITASMVEVAAQTKQNALHANQANELALVAKDNAVQGDEQMKETLQAMEAINNAAANISRIIKVIDEIAFQTNLLALNAAVEAARAGQHGKGFAVVAEEVRNLAARSANAAKETTVMIEDSIRKVEFGTKIAKETNGALNKIVEAIAQTTTLVGEIAIASNEQATAITQVNQAISQVDKVVQMNTATAEESASASEELSSQADLLKEMVARFKLKQAKTFFNNPTGVTPEVLKILEEMAIQKKASPVESLEAGKGEAASAASKIRISLDDQDFGKY